MTRLDKSTDNAEPLSVILLHKVALCMLMSLKQLASFLKLPMVVFAQAPFKSLKSAGLGATEQTKI